MTKPAVPAVLFVCVKNGGKSQMVPFSISLIAVAACGRLDPASDIPKNSAGLQVWSGN